MGNASGSEFLAELLGTIPEAFMHTALLAGGVGLWEWPTHDKAMSLSPHLQSLLGYPSGAFDGTKAAFLARINPLDLPRWELALTRALSGARSFDTEFRIADLHGGPRWLTAKGRVMRDSTGAALRLVGTMQEIDASIVSERRMRAQQSTLLDLASRPTPVNAGLDETLAQIAQASSDALEVRRTGIWLFGEGGSRLECRALYVHGEGAAPLPSALVPTEFPAYIAALRGSRALDVADAQNDPRTSELAVGYLRPLGIQSMLEAGVRLDDGTLVGVVCHEHVGPARQWLLDEKSFVASVADMVARALTDDRRRRLSAALALSEERYRNFLAISTEAILHAEFVPPVCTELPLDEQADAVAQRARIVETNAALATLVSAGDARELTGRMVASIWPEGLARRLAGDWVRAGYRLSEQEFEYADGEGRSRWILGSSIGVFENANLTHMWSTWRDITERKEALLQLERQARIDPLTGLPNRKWLDEHLGTQIARAQDAARRVALLLMDLDHFKEINDTLGHDAGDLLLRQIGPRLRPQLDAAHGDVARLGGDEFAIVLRGAGSDEEVLAHANALATSMGLPFPVGELRLGVDASVGAALYPEHGSDASALLRCADVAMYEAKRTRQRALLYSARLDRHSPRRLALANALGQSIAHGELEVHYQPIVGLVPRRLAGVEALARWTHPQYGEVLPDEFIPIAEMGDQIRRLTLHVLDTAARQWNGWRRAGLRTVVAINLSTRVLVDRSFVGDVSRTLERHAMPGAKLHFEITESAMLADFARAVAAITELNALGISFSIDDFGTGFSSLSYLKQLPLTSLKIDRSFVAQLTSNERDASIVRSTIHLAHELGLKVVAEGVESDELLAIVTRMGCDEAQGNGIAAAADGAALLAWAGATGWPAAPAP